MEIPASLFFGIWSNVGVLFLYLGFSTLYNTDLPDSVSPVVMFVFVRFLAIAASHGIVSSTRSLVFYTKLRTDVLNYSASLFLALLPVALCSIPAAAFRIYSVVNAFVLIYYFLPWKKRVLGGEFFYEASVAIAFYPILFVIPLSTRYASVFVSLCNFTVIFQSCYDLKEFFVQFHVGTPIFVLVVLTRVSPIVVLIPAFLTYIAEAAISRDERFRRWVPDEPSRVLSELRRIMKKNGDVIEFSVGMVGTILFQYFFRLTTFDHVKAFLYLAVAWLANLALLSCHRDLGVFNFLLSNVMVGCTVSQFGVGRTTWLVYAASLLLYILRVKLELTCLVTRHGKAVVAWRQNQTEETDHIV